MAVTQPTRLPEDFTATYQWNRKLVLPYPAGSWSAVMETLVESARRSLNRGLYDQAFIVDRRFEMGSRKFKGMHIVVSPLRVLTIQLH